MKFERMFKSFCFVIIRFYQYLISPLLGSQCRFYPSCSQYMKLAIEIHGFKGILLGIKRLFKCHPFYNGPFWDPVPGLSEVSHDK